MRVYTAIPAKAKDGTHVLLWFKIAGPPKPGGAEIAWVYR